MLTRDLAGDLMLAAQLHCATTSRLGFTCNLPRANSNFLTEILT
jgi:hypothetical protein